MMKSILTTIAFLALAVSGLAQTRSVIVNTSGVVQSPTNFWSANATNARSGLGLGTAATNPATAFQPSSSVLTNLSSSNGSALTNLTAANITGTVGLASNVTGTIAISNGGSGATTAGGARTNLGLGTTNSVVFREVATDGFKSFSDSGGFTEFYGPIWFEDSGGTNDIFQFETGAADQALARTNLGLPLAALTNANTTNFRTAIGLGATWLTNTNVINFKTAIGLEEITSSNGVFRVSTVGTERFSVDAAGDVRVITGQFILSGNSSAISFSTNNTSGAATTRTNLGLGWPALTNSNTATALLGYNTNNGNVVMPSSITFSNNVDFSKSIFATTNGVSAGGTLFAGSGSTISFYAAEDQSRWRTNLGLGWSALTNTNTSGFNTSLYGSNTNPVLYNTNGEVVSPTNFWQVAPIVTRFVEFDPSTNATTNIVAARNLHIHSLAISRTGVTSTIALPTNNVFNGDIALVVHQGPTSSVTQVGTQGSTNNLVTMNRTEEAVEFVYYNSVWQFNHNRSFVEPIYFSGTNAAGHAAESRTNLGLGSTNDVTFSSLTLSSDLTFGSGDNIVLSTTNGTKIGTATNQLLGFYNQTPITRPSSTGVTTNGFTTGGGVGVHANSTFTGNIGTNAYTISDVVAHLKSLGLLAP